MARIDRYQGWRRGSAGLRLLGLILVAAIAGMMLSLGLHPRAGAQSVLAVGGATTIYSRSSQAYAQPAPNLSAAWADRHLDGDIAFEAAFVTPPSQVNPGLGPLFNNNSCVACHINNGRGLQGVGQRLIRVSQQPHGQFPDLPGDLTYSPEVIAPQSHTPPVPGLGTQIQERGTHGYIPEATVEVTWQDHPGQYGDGTPYHLRSPQVHITRQDGVVLDDQIALSNRIPPPVFGLGLLEAVPEADLWRLADPDDRDRDGISGRPNQVWDEVQQRQTVGRFGWKANTPTLLQQTAAAYRDDMGVTNPLFPDDNGAQDIDTRTLEASTIYVQTLGVPGSVDWDDPQVQRGTRLFETAHCAACHVTALTTGDHSVPALAHQTIHPYTDLLLHDMGPELADNRPDFEANGQEWRTPPLWGLGVVQTVLPYSGYLHDGRARTPAEAILWHGGEAAASREAFRQMTAGDRAALIRFLQSL